MGNNKEFVSKKSAAEAAGVSIWELNKWVKRSRERRVEDEPWVWEIAEVCDNALESQAGTLEDKAWNRVIEGVIAPVIHKGEITDHYRKHDNGLLMKMLRRRDENYSKPAEKPVDVNLTIDIGDLASRIASTHRMQQIKQEEAALESPETFDETRTFFDVPELPKLPDFVE